jgi:hypothetical protein
MPLSNIIVIVARLFALNWLLHAFALIASALTTPSLQERPVSTILMGSAPGVLLLILGVFLWTLAPAVARFVSRGFDTTVSLGSLARSDLYSFAFVFLGLFFILSSFADVIDWIHYFTVSRDAPTRDPRIQSFYELTRPCLTLAGGLVCLLGAPRWTKKLVSRDEKSQVA